jgi:putative membrane protein
MQKWFFKVLVCSVNVFILAYILPGISIVKPLLIIFTLPATILTLGLFLFVINAAIILLDDYFVHGFEVKSFWYALLFGAVLSFFNSLVHKKAFPESKKNINQQ